MVLTSLLGSTLLRTQRSHLPPAFRRYKSLTAAIERGRQGGPDRPSRPRIGAPPERLQDANLKNRAERRFERFGPPKDSGNAADSGDRPQRERNGRSGSSRSSGFSGVRPPRSRNEQPSRFGGDRNEGPSRKWDRPNRHDNLPFGGRREDAPSRPSRFADRNEPSSDPYNNKERSGYRGDNERPRTGRREEAPSRPSRFADQNEPSSDQYNNKERSGYRGGNERPRTGRFDRTERPPPRMRDSDAGGRRPFERSGGFNDSRSRTSSFGRASTEYFPGDTPSRGSGRDAYQRGGSSTRPPRSFGSRDGPATDAPERPYRDRNERYGRGEAPTEARKHNERQTSSTRELESLPYTTAASEFVYGYSSVLAAMKANRRKLYKIYVHSRGLSRDGLMSRIRAQKLFPITEEVGDEHLRAMDKASSGRPHNGVVLESSPLPVPPITELKTASMEDASFSVSIGSQSTEDALVNGKQELYSYKAAGWRHPLVLYVDGVLDEGNLGAIARSAYFLGVDALVTPTRQTAPWSNITLKASAGAAEALPIFKISEPADFLGKSARAGWRIYGSDAIPPPRAPVLDSGEEPEGNIIYTVARSTKRLPADHCPVAEHPTILMMGAEGTGLRDSLLNLAHYKVGIRHGREVDEVGVDSLNVSVAASLLCNEMLQKPINAPTASPKEVLF